MEKEWAAFEHSKFEEMYKIILGKGTLDNVHISKIMYVYIHVNM